MVFHFLGFPKELDCIQHIMYGGGRIITCMARAYPRLTETEYSDHITGIIPSVATSLG